MIRTALGAVAVIACGAPAGLGLLGNSSFSQAVPVRTPQQAVHATATTPLRVIPTSARRAGDGRADDHRHHRGGEVEPGDDRGRHAEPGDDRGRHAEPGDDRGRHAEPGDDRGRHAEPGNDRRGRPGRPGRPGRHSPDDRHGSGHRHGGGEPGDDH
jgi:hypothetical protein